MANQNHQDVPPFDQRGEREQLPEELLQVARRYAGLPVPQPTSGETSELIARLQRAAQQNLALSPVPAPRRPQRVRHLLEALAACLLVGALIGSFVLIFAVRGPHHPAQQVSSKAQDILVSLSDDTKPFPGPPTIVANRASDGKHLWSYVISQRLVFAVFPAITVQDQVVYVKGEQQVYALRASDGKLLWHSNLPWPSSPGNPPFFGHDSGALVADHGLLFTQLLDDTSETVILFALRASDGHVLWQHQTGVVEEHFTVAAGNIYASVPFPGNIYQLLALQETTGHVLWSYTGSISSIAQQGGRVYAVSIVWHLLPEEGQPQHMQPEGTLLALSAQSGKLLWSSKIAVTSGASEKGGQLIPEQDRLLFFNGSQLCAYRISDGRQLWCAAAGSMFALANHTIYALGGSQNDQLEALDSTTGAVLWSKTVPVSLYTQLSIIAIMQNSIYLLAAPEGGTASLYALSLTDGHQLWSYTYPFATQATAAGS